MFALHRPPLALADRTTSASPQAELPIQSRIWHLFCQGYSYTAIGEQVGLERHAVARHVRAAESLLAAEHTDHLALTRHRALEAAFNLLAVTMDHLMVEGLREDAIWREYERALASLPPDDPPDSPRPLHDGTPASDPSLPPVPVKYYRAGRTRLLTIALAALRHAIRLSGLDGDAQVGAFSLPGLPFPPSPSDPLPPTAPLSQPPSMPSAPSPLTSSSAPFSSQREGRRGLGTQRPSAELPKPVAAIPPNTGTKWNIPIRAQPSPRPSARQPKPPAPHRRRPVHR